MKALKITLLIIGILAALVLVPPLFMSPRINVEKSMVMQAEPEVIFVQVNCFRNWEPWTPWADEAINVAYEGADCGQGAIMSWEDGGGRSTQVITESIENKLIRTELNFMEQGSVWSDWTFEKTDAGTLVTWNLKGDADYPIGRWINTLFIQPEVGKSYVKGLTALNEYTKDMKPQPGYLTSEVTAKEVSSMNALAMKVTSTMNEMEVAMSASFNQLMEVAGKSGLQITGSPFVIWYKWEGDEFEFDNCIPIAKPFNVSGNVRGIKTYAGKVVSLVHTGHYDTSGNSWMVLENYVKENNLESNGDPWEVYLTNPQEEPDPANWKTELVWPVK